MTSEPLSWSDSSLPPNIFSRLWVDGSIFVRFSEGSLHRFQWGVGFLLSPRCQSASRTSTGSNCLLWNMSANRVPSPWFRIYQFWAFSAAFQSVLAASGSLIFSKRPKWKWLEASFLWPSSIGGRRSPEQSQKIYSPAFAFWFHDDSLSYEQASTHPVQAFVDPLPAYRDQEADQSQPFLRDWCHP